MTKPEVLNPSLSFGDVVNKWNGLVRDGFPEESLAEFTGILVFALSLYTLNKTQMRRLAVAFKEGKPIDLQPK